MMNPSDFYNDNNWLGSFYELAIDLGPVREDWELVLAGLRSIWTAPGIKGPFTRESADPSGEVSELPDDDCPTASSLDEYSVHLFGQIEVANGQWIGCGACKVREGKATNSGGGHDWLVLYIPVGMLELAFDVRYPLYSEPNPWIDTVNDALVKIADHICTRVPFDLSFVGEEVSGIGDTSTISREMAEFGGVLLSPELASRIAPDIACDVLDSRLRWYPPSWDTSVGIPSSGREDSQP